EEIGQSLELVVQARLDRLHQDENNLLMHAAAIGKTFSAPFLTAIGIADPVAQLSRLIGRDLIVAVTERRQVYQFRNDILREVAYGLIPADERARLHLACADYL